MDIRIIGRDIQIDATAAMAIENDNATETACFILDRYTESGVDLSVMSGFIVYANELGTRFEVLNMELDGDRIQAKWTVTRSLTTVNGRFLFCLTFLSADTYEGLPDAEKVWSTNIAKSNITSSLVGDDYAVPEEPIMLQMLEIAGQIVASGNAAKANADRAETALQAAETEKSTAEAAAGRAEDAAVAVNEKITAAQSQIHQSQTLINLAQALIDQERVLIGQLTAKVDQINGEVV